MDLSVLGAATTELLPISAVPKTSHCEDLLNSKVFASCIFVMY